MKKITLLKSLFVVLALSLFSFSVVAETATLTFDNESKRTVSTTSQQVWVENGITFTYDKASYTNNLAEYHNPMRCYKGTSVTIAIAEDYKISKIEFDCNSSSYATSLHK